MVSTNLKRTHTVDFLVFILIMINEIATLIGILIYTRWKNYLLARSAESLMQQCVRKQMRINNILKLPSTNEICQKKNNFGVTGKAILPPTVNTDTVLVRFWCLISGNAFQDRYEVTGQSPREGGKKKRRKKKKTRGLENMTYEKRLKKLSLFSLKKKKARKRHDNSLQICKIVRRKKNYFLHMHWIEIETTVAKYVFSKVW